MTSAEPLNFHRTHMENKEYCVEKGTNKPRVGLGVTSLAF